MRPVEYKTEDIIQAGLELRGISRKVSGFSLRQKVGGGNPKRLEQVWNDYLASQHVIKAESAAELPSEMAEAVRVVALALTEQLSRLAIELNDKAVKAAERRVKEEEGINLADNQRKQAELKLPDASQTVEDLEINIDEIKINTEKLEKKLADAQAIIQSQAIELAALQERLALTDQAAKTQSEQHAAELERLQNALTEQTSINQILIAKNDDAHKQTAITAEEPSIVNGQLEITKAPGTELKPLLSDLQKGTKNQEIDSRKCHLPNPMPDAYQFSRKQG